MFHLLNSVQQDVPLWNSLSYLFNTSTSLFVMVDPFAAIPIYLIITERFSKEEVKKTRRKAIFVATGILMLFALTGMSLLNFFSVSISALRVAGGILLLKFALEHMTSGSSSHRIDSDEEDESKHKDDISVVPLAMPLLAGPGSISTVIVQSTKGFSFVNLSLLLLAIVLVMATSYATLKYSQYLFRFFGRTGLNLFGRIMGILVAAIAIEFILTGLKDSFPHLWQ